MILFDENCMSYLTILAVLDARKCLEASIIESAKRLPRLNEGGHCWKKLVELDVYFV
jgi:hypothetical protein